MLFDGWGGLWVIFPIIMIPAMLASMYVMFIRGGGMFMRGGGRPPWQEFVRENREPEEHRSAMGSESALDILRRRNAGGEITKAEFDEMKQDLA